MGNSCSVPTKMCCKFRNILKHPFIDPLLPLYSINNIVDTVLGLLFYWLLYSEEFPLFLPVVRILSKVVVQEL